MLSLSNLVLSQRNIHELYNIYQQTGMIDIEREIGRRLSNCNYETINFIHANRNNLNTWLDSVYIKQGLERSFSCLPWKISVIYNFTDESYRVNNILVSLGDTDYRTGTGKRFVPTRDQSNITKLVMREIVSKNSKINGNMSVRTNDTNLDNAIRQTLINNDVATISVCLFVPAINQSYDQALRESKTMYPCNISTSEFNHNLLVLPPGINSLDYNVRVTKSSIYQKLVDLYILTRNT